MRLFAHARRHGLASIGRGADADCSQASPVRFAELESVAELLLPNPAQLRVAAERMTELGGTRALVSGATSGLGLAMAGRSWTRRARCHHEP